MTTTDNKRESRHLDEALEDTFPASDTPSQTAPVSATPSESMLPAGEHSANHPGTVTVYRVVSEEQVDKPFGENGNSGGRWTSEGVPTVYASLSAANALLEFLAHCRDKGVPDKVYMATASIPRRCMLTQAALPSTWCERPYRDEVRNIGDDWSKEHRSLALQVPSAVCSETCNVLLNPRHVDYPLLQSVHVQEITIDERLR